MRRFLASLVGLLAIVSWSSAQTPVRLRWAPNQVLLYKIEHTTESVDTSADSKSETRTMLKATRRWQVMSVDAAGTATLQMSIIAMQTERTTASGDVLKYDSANPDAGTPQLKEAMAKFLNTPLATVRIDAAGRVVEVKESKSDASGFENELPFFVALPAAIKANDAWQRDYKITLPPPLGTGEKTEAVQKYRCKALTETAAVVAMTTELKTPPKAAADAVPLWQLMPEGDVVFDVKNGRLYSAKLTVSKELKDHQGANTSLTFKSSYSLLYAGDR